MDAPLLYTLIALPLVALVIGAIGPAYVAAVLLCNLVTCWLISEALGTGFNYFALASIDLVSAMLILLPPVSRGQIAVAATYVFGLCCHAAYAALGESLVTQGQYWSALFFMAWGQVCIVVIWAGVDGIGVYRSNNHPISRLRSRWCMLDRACRRMDNEPAAINGIAKVVEVTAPISPFGPLNTGLISIMIGLLIYAMKNQIANRKMTIQVNGEMRQEWIDEMAVIRGELRSARDENGQLRDDIHTLRTEVRKKDDKIDQLRDEVRGLHGVIDGMRRENLTGQLTAQRIVADMMPQSPEIERAIKSLGNIQGDSK